MNVNMVSDLHLESSNLSLQMDASVDVALFLGDISVDLEQAFSFMDRARGNATGVFVAGNHEYEGKEIEAARETMRALAKKYGIYFLDNQALDLGEVVILGTTLWSGFDLFPGLRQESMSAAQFGVCDFSTIFQGRKVLTVESMRHMHLEAVDWLRRALLENRGKKIVVASHFAPFSPSLHPKYEHLVNSAYWVNRLDDEFGGLCEVWGHGHTHDSKRYDMHGTQVHCNPRGSSRLFDLASNVHFKKDYPLEL